MRRAGLFVTVGAIGFLVQLASLAELTSGWRWHWLPATLVSVEVAIVYNFRSRLSSRSCPSCRCIWLARTGANVVSQDLRSVPPFQPVLPLLALVPAA